tara:strand:- start:319 stop:1002 length:684 start_codon:yes stop_codon:yes gene_type:complete
VSTESKKKFPFGGTEYQNFKSDFTKSTSIGLGFSEYQSFKLGNIFKKIKDEEEVKSEDSTETGKDRERDDTTEGDTDLGVVQQGIAIGQVQTGGTGPAPISLGGLSNPAQQGGEEESASSQAIQAEQAAAEPPPEQPSERRTQNDDAVDSIAGDESNEDADNKTDVKSGPGTPDHKDQKPEPVTVTRETVFYGGELANASQEERDAFEAEMLKLAEDTKRQIEETKK